MFSAVESSLKFATKSDGVAANLMREERGEYATVASTGRASDMRLENLRR